MPLSVQHTAEAGRTQFPSDRRPAGPVQVDVRFKPEMPAAVRIAPVHTVGQPHQVRFVPDPVGFGCRTVIFGVLRQAQYIEGVVSRIVRSHQRHVILSGDGGGVDLPVCLVNSHKPSVIGLPEQRYTHFTGISLYLIGDSVHLVHGDGPAQVYRSGPRKEIQPQRDILRDAQSGIVRQIVRSVIRQNEHDVIRIRIVHARENSVFSIGSVGSVNPVSSISSVIAGYLRPCPAAIYRKIHSVRLVPVPQFRPGFQSRGNCLITFIPGGTYLVSIGIRHPGRSTCARLHGPVVQVVGGFGHSYNRAYSVDSVLAIFAILTVFAVFTILTVLAVLYGNIASFRERDDIPLF